MTAKRAKNRAGRFAGNHQRSWIWGKQAVLETLAGKTWPILELHLAPGAESSFRDHIEAHAAHWGVTVEQTSRTRLRSLCGATAHQGCIARLGPFPYTPPDRLIERLRVDGRVGLVVLDRIQDPHNFGAILRSAEVLGMAGAVVGAEGQAEVGSHVARSSAGAVNRLPVARAESLVDFVDRCAATGAPCLAASEKDGLAAHETLLARSFVLVMGNEGAGVSRELGEVCGQHVRIPQLGRVGSLNVAAAAAILFYEAARQRGFA